MSDTMGGLTSSGSVASGSNTRTSRLPIPPVPSLHDKILNALSLFKESSEGGILAQVWVPIKQGDELVLSTFEQPFLLDNKLAGYREISRTYTFNTREAPGCFPGLPGRVFIARRPEWTSNVVYYIKTEYLRVQHAVDHEVRGSLAVPVFDSHEQSCCAVLELVTIEEKQNFQSEMENIFHALKAVDLRTVALPRAPPPCLSMNHKVALAEIVDILRYVCHAHNLPLALTWIPVSNYDEMNDEGKLCIEETACYVSSKEVEAFVNVCAENYLNKGQGMAGKALESNHPFFSPDVKGYDIREYPLVHHARKFGLNAAVAIRLRSTYTGSEDYILEFFLPISCRGSSEQQVLLNGISSAMQRICKSLKTVTDAELGEAEDIKSSLKGKM